MPETSAGFELGPITFHYYSLFVVLGLSAGAGLAYFRSRRTDEDPEFLVDFLTWGILFALIFARLFYIWNPPPSVAPFYDRAWYVSHPLDLQTGAVAIWAGGLGMAGGLLGVVVGTGLVLWRNRLDLQAWARILAPGLLLTLAITPWGNLLIRQMVGKPTSLPWGMIIDPWPAGYDQVGVFPEGATGFHPLPAYLALWALLSLASYFVWGRLPLQPLTENDVLASALMYLLGVFVFDFLRLDVNRGLIGLTGMQWIALLLIATALGWLLIRYRFVSKKGGDSVA